MIKSFSPIARSLAISGVLFCTQAHADLFIDIRINNTTAAGVVGKQFYEYDAVVSAEVMHHSRDGDLFAINAFKVHDENIHHFEIGGKALFAFLNSPYDDNLGALAISGAYHIQVAEGINFYTHAAWSPEILTFDPYLKNFYQLGGQVEFDVIPDVTLHVGYHSTLSLQSKHL